MAKTKNEIHLVARLGKDAELRNLQSGASITRMPVCTEHSFKDRNGEWQKDVEWFSICVVGRKAPEAARFRKGELVALTGRIQTRTFEKDGETKSVTQVITFEVKPATEEVDDVRDDNFWNRA